MTEEARATAVGTYLEEEYDGQARASAVAAYLEEEFDALLRVTSGGAYAEIDREHHLCVTSGGAYVEIEYPWGPTEKQKRLRRVAWSLLLNIPMADPRHL